MNWQRVTIFISSTFNDMHAERDYLVKDVFPELREWCENRKIHLVDVDLRWGVTEEDSSSNHTVLACLNNIDNSRPFFLCFLGQRRGWVPAEVSPETLDEYPDISSVIGRSSVTEMEIEHALLAPMKHIVNGNEQPEAPVNHALFYFRTPDYVSDLTEAQQKIFTNAGEKDKYLADNELATFKEKIRDKWNYTTDYNCRWDKTIISPELLKVRDKDNNIIARTDGAEQGRLTDFNTNGISLKDIIIEQLKEEIKKEFPDRKDEFAYSSALERDLDQQALFIELNSEGFISREGDFDAINSYLSNNKTGLFILTAPAGYGKSMLLANFIIKESQKVNARFFNRFCGVSDLCSQQYSLWKTIFDKANVQCPDTLKDLKNNIGDLLKELAKEKTVIIIDAINQLPDGLDMLEWLPKQLPENLKIILSLKEDDKDENLTAITEKWKDNENSDWSNVKPFENKDEKKNLIKDYLKKYLKSLDEKQIDAICDSTGSKNPLYLKILLSELRIFGSFDQLSGEIKSFGETPKEAFNAVLSRLEKDVNSLNINSEEFTPLLFGLLANARNGLSDEELKQCIHQGLPHIEEEKLIPAINLFIRQVRPFMARREGRTDYFYEAFQLAAKERYVNDKIRYNKILADYFQQQADPDDDLSFNGITIRDFNELPYHLKESENTELLEKMLSAYRWIKNKTELSDIYNTIDDYSYIDDENDENYHLKLIKDTLIMSAHVLKDYIKNLPTQLWGRLKEIENPQIKVLLIEIDKYTDYPWLKPRHYMQSPESALKVTLTHTKRVNTICYSPNGKYIISGSGDGSVRVWDWKKQKEITKLEGHTENVSSICISNDERFIASGSGDGSVRVWDWKNEREIIKLEGHTTNVYSVYFSPDGQYIVSGSSGFHEKDDNTIRVWDWKKQKEIAKLDGHSIGRVLSMCFSPNGRYIASCSLDATIRIWDWKRQEEIRKLSGYTHTVEYLCFSPNGRYIASVSEESLYTTDGQVTNDFSTAIHIWDWENKREIKTLEGLNGRLCGLCFSPDGQYIASGLSDNTIHIWEWEKEKEIRKLEGNTDLVLSICFSPDGQYIASGSYDTSVRVWGWKRYEKTRILEKHIGTVNRLCFSLDGRYIATGSNDGTIRIWDWENMREIRKLEGYTGTVTSVCFSPDGRYVASGSGGEWPNNTIRVWDWEKQKEIVKLKGHSYVTDVESVCFSPDGQYIVSGALDNICIWDWKNEREIKKLERSVLSACFSPNGQYIASGGIDNIIRVWDWENEREIRKLEGHTTMVRSICFSDDGRYIASGSADETIRVWNWENEKEIIKLEGHTDDVRNLNFSNGGQYIISGSSDKTVRIWDWEKQIQIIALNTEEVIYSCAFSKTNLQIAAGGTSGQLLIYDIENLPADEKLQPNDFTSDAIILEDENTESKENKIENITDSKEEKKKGFLSRLFGK